MKKYIIPLIIILLSIICFISYQTTKPKVTPDGTLVEPFALLPFGYLLLIIGIIWILVVYTKNLPKQSK